MKKVYCVNNECPCRAKKNKVWAANYDGVCRDYISWLLNKSWRNVSGR